MKTKKIIIWLLIAGLFGFVSIAAANGSSDAKSIYVSQNDIVTGNLSAVADNLIIDGRVAGDVIAIAKNIRIDGRVEGDIIAVASQIEINGRVDGNVRAAGENIIINGSVAKNVNAATSRLVFGPKSQVGWDVSAIGESLEADGNFNGGIDGIFADAWLLGTINRPVNLNYNHKSPMKGIHIGPEAKINSDINYISLDQTPLENANKVSGKINRRPPVAKPVGTGHTIFGWLWSAIAAFLVGWIMLKLFPKVANKAGEKAEKQAWRAIISGLIVVIGLPIIAILAMITIIGIPLGLILLAVWLVAIYLSKIVSAFVVGRLIFAKFYPQGKLNDAWRLAGGIVIVYLLSSLPIIGGALSTVAAIFGLGVIYNYADNKSRNL